MHKRLAFLIVAGLLLARGALAMCYEVYAGDRLVYRSTTTPVDLSRPLHETVPAQFGRGAALMFFPIDAGCLNFDARVSAPVLGNEDVGAKFGSANAPARNLDQYFRDR
jgi:hypothetical protein